MIAVGSLNRKVQIQKRVGIKDEYGQESQSWVKLADVWANIKPVSGREKLRNSSSESTLTDSVAIRYQANLMPVTNADAWRIVYNLRIFDINAAKEFNDARRFIIFDCIETGIVDGNNKL